VGYTVLHILAIAIFFSAAPPPSLPRPTLGVTYCLQTGTTIIISADCST
jgi:hypothetical protein